MAGTTSTDRIMMTPMGHRKLLAEIQTLVTERSRIIKEIEEARLLGDLSENAQYDVAKRAQAMNTAKSNELQTLLANTTILDIKTLQFFDKVAFGMTVLLFNEQAQEKVEYTLVGAYESDIENGLLSIESPLARALLGKGIGDIAELRLPKGVRTYNILSISVKESAIL